MHIFSIDNLQRMFGNAFFKYSVQIIKGFNNIGSWNTASFKQSREPQKLIKAIYRKICMCAFN